MTLTSYPFPYYSTSPRVLFLHVLRRFVYVAEHFLSLFSAIYRLSSLVKHVCIHRHRWSRGRTHARHTGFASLNLGVHNLFLESPSCGLPKSKSQTYNTVIFLYFFGCEREAAIEGGRAASKIPH
jgi:hypothetical protein